MHILHINKLTNSQIKNTVLQHTKPNLGGI